MANKADIIKLKEEHIQLAEIVKGVHKRLRRKYRTNDKTQEQVWHEHVQDHLGLQLYADAMYRLATEHWSVFPETRIDWCRKVANEYFYQKGLQVALEKDVKRKYHEQLRMKQKCNVSALNSTPSVSTGASLPCYKNGIRQTDVLPQHNEVLGITDAASGLGETPQVSEVHSGIEITVPVTDRIRLLDVGSCYNPFLSFGEFDVLGIDLSPAKETVLQCDFLQLSTPTLSHPLSLDLQTLKSPLQQLPVCSFHVVVFSLLLEYFPSPEQRWQCCVKAYSLLAVNGLLLIITPDSHSQHRNAPMIKSWKQALESLGFLRWRYEKKDHIHCMAFRKLAQRSQSTHAGPGDSLDVERVKAMLYIPQDYNDACYDGTEIEQTISQESVEDTEAFMKLVKEELPVLEDN